MSSWWNPANRRFTRLFTGAALFTGSAAGAIGLIGHWQSAKAQVPAAVVNTSSRARPNQPPQHSPTIQLCQALNLFNLCTPAWLEIRRAHRGLQ